MALLVFAEQAHAIPTFSRKYRTSCITCHTIFPQLTDTGEAFRRNGYQFPSGEELLVKDEPVPFGPGTVPGGGKFPTGTPLHPVSRARGE